ncbi:MAG: tRNA dihydrouridine(16) synthase DusC [Plesiomonas sp.]|uniref:tRNA dihydrouridine(16) synthase DusC n=1 Tax=Plesiomonas sp. TaxID=2486279 RepID=UPI003F2D353B
MILKPHDQRQITPAKIVTGRVILAPMEGVLDPLLRDLLTRINAYDLCVTEFVRVVDALLPEHLFYRLCPELHHGGLTPSGTPVRVQLLGQSPQWLAENAARAVALGSQGIDLNCGCPSKKVNGSDGGASLLKDPNLIYRATKTMREAVPNDMPVTVKVRLGWDSTDHSMEIADAVQQAGATEIAIHGRTKADGYKADKINWPAIGVLRQRLHIPVIANGEITDYASALRCRELTGCTDLMLGRGALNVPNLANVVKYNHAPLSWAEVVELLLAYTALEKNGDKGFYHSARIKQWFSYLRKQYAEADALFAQIRTLQRVDEMVAVLSASQDN